MSEDISRSKVKRFIKISGMELIEWQRDNIGRKLRNFVGRFKF